MAVLFDWHAATGGAVGAAGVLLGHWLAYLAALPQARVRSATLLMTGHGYWTDAVRVAVALGASGLAALLLVHFGAHGPDGQAPTNRFSSLLLRLGPIQCVAFIAVESTERVVAHVPITDVFRTHVLVLGLALQILTACLGSVLLVWLDRAVATIAGILRRRSPHPVRRPIREPKVVTLRPRPALSGASGVRGPPLR